MAVVPTSPIDELVAEAVRAARWPPTVSCRKKRRRPGTNPVSFPPGPSFKGLFWPMAVVKLYKLARQPVHPPGRRWSISGFDHDLPSWPLAHPYRMICHKR